MKKRLLFTAAFAAVLFSFLFSSCSSLRENTVYNTFSLEETGLEIFYSLDGESFAPLTADEAVLRKRIFAAGDQEKIHLSVCNKGEGYARFSLSVVTVGGIAPPRDLFYGYGEEAVPSYAIGEEGRDAYLLAPAQSLSLQVGIGVTKKDTGVVAPLLGLSFKAESVSMDFDPTLPESFTLLPGKQVRDAIPDDTREVIFTDACNPNGIAAVDLSASQNGAVWGWSEDKTFYISSCIGGMRVRTGDDASYLFSKLSFLERVSLAGLDTSGARDFMRFFAGCSSLAHADLASIDTQSAVRLRSMFNGCASLSDADVGSWNVSSVRDAAYLFAGTTALERLDLSAWDLSLVLYTTAMLQSSGVREISLPETLPEIGTFFFNHVDGFDTSVFTLPSSVRYVARAHTFYDFGTDAFTAFAVDEASTAARALDGVLYSADGTVLLAVPNGKRFENGIFEIAEGTTLLGELSFSRNPYIKTVVLPNSYRVKVYYEKYHADFAEPSKLPTDSAKTGNINTGNSLNLAIYAYVPVESYAVKPDNPLYVSHEGALYEKSKGGAPSALIAVPICYEGVLAIPEGVRTIADEAFWEDGEVPFAGITEIRIPASLIEMGEGQLEKLNTLTAKLTVDADNPVYAQDANGKIYKK